MLLAYLALAGLFAATGYALGELAYRLCEADRRETDHETPDVPVSARQVRLNGGTRRFEVVDVTERDAAPVLLLEAGEKRYRLTTGHHGRAVLVPDDATPAAPRPVSRIEAE